MNVKKDLVPRPVYIRQLMDFQDRDIIKVVTGIRRSGKSTLLRLFKEHLRTHGVKEDQIVYMNFESAEFENITDPDSLYQYVKNRICDTGRTYIFLDEIQMVPDFEKAVNKFMVDFDVDLYITGSNAYVLSSDLSTLLSGRYVEIVMRPLSFQEYMSAQDPGRSPEDCFYDYMKYGGFPFIAREHDERRIGAYLDGVYNTVVLKDVIERNGIKNAVLIEKLLRFVFSSMGSIVSPSSISKAIGGSGKTVTNETIENYLDMLCRAYILSKVARYDIKGKEYLKTLNKYYVVDLGLRNHVLGYRQLEPTHALENIIYFELLRRGYKVDIGKVDQFEVEFVARNREHIQYYQVAWTVSDPMTREREYRPFDAIPDHYEKFLITMDRDPVSSVNGVKKIYAVDFLLS
jgi:predicted AAA+ superfamily ATPase